MSDPSCVRVAGPLERYARGFAAELDRLGYTPLSAANQLRVMAHLSHWLLVWELDPAELTDERVDMFLAARRDQGYSCWLSRRGLAPMLDCLRELGWCPCLLSRFVPGRWRTF